METLALVILSLATVIGFIAIFFTTFGTLIIMLGSVAYAFMMGFEVLTIRDLLILLTLYFCGEVSEYVFIIVGAKKLGASNAAVVGALVGAIIGAVFGTAFFGVGLILGTFLGLFLGAFIVELIIQKDLVKSLKAGTGGVLGRIGATITKVIIAAIMIAIIITRVITYTFI